LPLHLARARLHETAAAIRRKRGVVAVFYGLPSRGGQWRPDERVLSVHVLRKEPPTELSRGRLLPACLAGLDTDVLESGRPCLSRLDVTDRARCQREPGNFTRDSTLTAVASTADGARVLMSGHAALPREPNGRLLRQWRDDGSPAGAVAVDDDASTWMGRLEYGEMGGTMDFCVASFSAAPHDPLHPLLGVTPPFPLRRLPPEPGELVRTHSRLPSDPGPRPGRVVGLLLGVLEAELGDGTRVRYTDLVCVAPVEQGPPFSRPGDSGALVADAEGRALGVVVAGSENHALSYVLPLLHLEAALGQDMPLFFR
jgi:hypothetical protein